MNTPSQTAHHMSRVRPHSLERSIQSRSADRIVDNVEAFGIGMPSHILIDRIGLIVNRDGTKALNNLQFFLGDCREDLSPKGTGDLHSHPTNPACSRLHQYLLSRLDLGTIYQSLPRRDEDERSCRRFTHRKTYRLDGQQI